MNLVVEITDNVNLCWTSADAMEADDYCVLQVGGKQEVQTVAMNSDLSMDKTTVTVNLENNCQEVENKTVTLFRIERN